MDPVSIIVTALATGAAAGLKPAAEQAIKDAYNGIKSLILRKYTHTSVDLLEAEPASKTRQAVVGEDLQKAGAGNDRELLEAARPVLEWIQKNAPEIPETVGVRLSDIKGAVLSISDITSTGSGVVIAGADISGAIEIKGVKAGDRGPERNPS